MLLKNTRILRRISKVTHYLSSSLVDYRLCRELYSTLSEVINFVTSPLHKSQTYITSSLRSELAMLSQKAFIGSLVDELENF